MKRDVKSRLEAAVRAANPVPSPDDLVDSDEAAAVTLLVERGRNTMTTPTIPQIKHPQSPRRRPPMWSFAAGLAVVLLVVGAAALFLRDDRSAPVADEPAPPPTVALPEPEPEEPLAGWQRIREAWLLNDGSIEGLSGGAFVAASSVEHPEGSRLMWSPDGLVWLDGDPHDLLPRVTKMAVVGDQVIVLTGAEDDIPAPWVGDPKTGDWGPLAPLDTSGLEGRLLPWTFGISAGADEVLITAVTAVALPDMDDPGEVGEVVAWQVDPELKTTIRTELDTEKPGRAVAWPTAWFDGRWHVWMPWKAVEYYWVETALWSSFDGMTWREDQLPAGWHLPLLNAPTTGKSGAVICATIGAVDDTAATWFTADGVEWQRVRSGGQCRGVFSESLGFVFDDGNRLSPDGMLLEPLETPFPFDVVAASGNNLIVHAYRGSENSARESAVLEGLWLYRQPTSEVR